MKNSMWFYIFYLIGGLSDMLDGFAARKTNAVSQFGARLDSIADLIEPMKNNLLTLPLGDNLK